MATIGARATGSVTDTTVDLSRNDRSAVLISLGFWSAVVATLGAVGFAAGIVLNATILPTPTWTGDIRAYASSYGGTAMAVTVVPSLLIVPAFVALIASFYAAVPRTKQPLVLLALTLAAVYAATVGTNYFLQLTVVRQNLEAGTTEGMALLAMANPRSIFWAFEFLGYFWQGLAAGVLALALGEGRVQSWIRWLLATVFAAALLGGLAAVRGATSFFDPLMLAGSIPWVIAFPVATALCAIYFKRLATSGSREAAID